MRKGIHCYNKLPGSTGTLAGKVLPFLFLVLALQADASTKKPPLKPVNINTATAGELQQVPGIGPSTAAKIVQMRKSYGAFKSVDDLLAIRGIGRKRLEKMRKYLTVGKVIAGSNKAPPVAKKNL